jgi:hypothetical protein
MEVEKLRVVLAKKDHSSTVDMSVRLWSSFHAKMDICIRDGVGVFRRSTEGPVGLGPSLNTALKKSSPAGFSGSSKSAQSARTQQGVPMFSFTTSLCCKTTSLRLRTLASSETVSLR